MWKDIKHWELYYEINEFGEVKNKLNGKLLIGDINSCGYERVCLYNKNHNPQKQRFFRHRLVAEHFIDNPNTLKEINHKDHNIHNNYYKNLEWCDRFFNEIDSHKNGTKPYKPYQVEFENGGIKIYDTAPQLARILKVDRKTIKDWLLKKTFGYKKYGIIKIEYI